MFQDEVYKNFLTWDSNEKSCGLGNKMFKTLKKSIKFCEKFKSSVNICDYL